jgi:putative FmdB family regulatory protein
MPTYDYECPEGHRFEVFQKMSDDPVAECPECGAEARRQISGGAGFLFRGEGFYITDYRSDDYRKKASADKGPSKAESSSGDSSSSGGSSGGTGSSGGAKSADSGSSGSSSSGD